MRRRKTRAETGGDADPLTVTELAPDRLTVDDDNTSGRRRRSGREGVDFFTLNERRAAAELPGSQTVTEERSDTP